MLQLTARPGKKRPNLINKSDLIYISQSVLKGYELFNDTTTYRRKFAEEFEDWQRVYIRTMRYKFQQWAVKGFPDEWACSSRERRRTLFAAEKFFKSIIEDKRYGKRNGRTRLQNQIGDGSMDDSPS